MHTKLRDVVAGIADEYIRGPLLVELAAKSPTVDAFEATCMLADTISDVQLRIKIWCGLYNHTPIGRAQATHDATRQKILALENDQLRRIAITRFAASLTPCFSYAQRLQRYTELCEDMNAIGNESERATGLKDLLAYAPGLRYASVHTRIGEMAQAIGDDALRTSLEDALVKYAPPA